MSNIICHLEHIPFPGPTTGVDGGFKIGMLSNGTSGTVSIIMWHNAASENVKPNCRLLCVYERGHKTSGAMTFTRHFIIEKVFLFPSHAGPVAIYACYDLEACSCLFTQGFFEYFFLVRSFCLMHTVITPQIVCWSWHSGFYLIASCWEKNSINFHAKTWIFSLHCFAGES